MQTTHLILAMLNFGLPVAILLFVLLSSSSLASATIEMADSKVSFNKRQIELFFRQAPPKIVNITVCTQQNWSGYCQTLNGSASTCLSVPPPFSTDDKNNIGNVGIYSAGPDPRETCYFYNSTDCDASKGMSFPIIYPGYANVQDFPVYDWTYNAIIIPQAWLCVVNNYSE